MAEVTKVKVEESVVVYTIKHKGKDSLYAIPRVFTREEADSTLLAHLKSFTQEEENSTDSVSDWSIDTEGVSLHSLEKRVRADEEARAKIAKTEEDRKAKERKEAAKKEAEVIAAQMEKELGPQPEQPTEDVEETDKKDA